MTKPIIVLAACVALAGCNQPAATSNADSSASAAPQAAIPDLKGTWTGTSESIVRGSALHHAPQTGKDPLLDNVLFTYVISGQDGHRFWGKVSSARGEEPITGVVEHDGKTIVARDNDGEIRGAFIDADTIDFVYDHGGGSTVVALNTIKRQK